MEVEKTDSFTVRVRFKKPTPFWAGRANGLIIPKRRDRLPFGDALLAFYDFPAEHWKHLRTTNPIESTLPPCHDILPAKAGRPFRIERDRGLADSPLEGGGSNLQFRVDGAAGTSADLDVRAGLAAG